MRSKQQKNLTLAHRIVQVTCAREGLYVPMSYAAYRKTNPLNDCPLNAAIAASVGVGK